MPLTTALTSY